MCLLRSNHITVAFVAFALVVSFARGPREKRWLGWSGGWGIWRDDVPRKKINDAPEEGAEAAIEIDNRQQNLLPPEDSKSTHVRS